MERDPEAQRPARAGSLMCDAGYITSAVEHLHTQLVELFPSLGGKLLGSCGYLCRSILTSKALSSVAMATSVAAMQSVSVAQVLPLMRLTFMWISVLSVNAFDA